MKALAKVESKVTKPAGGIYGLIDEFVVKYDRLRTEASRRSYRKSLRHFAAFASNAQYVNTGLLLSDYRNHVSNTLAAKSANLYISALRAFCRWLSKPTDERLPLLPEDYADRLAGVKEDRGEEDYFGHDIITDDENRKILASFGSTFKDVRDRAIWAVMSCAGLRTIEVCRANLEGLEYLGKDAAGNPVVFLRVWGKGKSAANAKVRVPAPVMRLVEDYLQARILKADVSVPAKMKMPLSQWCIRENVFKQDVKGTPLFAAVGNRDFGGRLCPESLSQLIKSIFRRNGFDSARISAHSLRHLAISTALNHGAALEEVRQMARHSSLTVTQRYLHIKERIHNPSECLAAAAFGLIC